MSKSQKKIVKKFNKFINTGEINKNLPTNDNTDASESNSDELFMVKERPKKTGLQLESCENFIPSASTSTITNSSNVDKQTTKKPEPNSRSVSSVLNDKPTTCKKGLGPDPLKVPCKKAKLLRLERKQKKLEEKGLALEIPKTNISKDLEQLLNEITENSTHKIKVSLSLIYF